jgi:branched-chain amino acid transport system substrate-binding protein
MVTTLAAGCGTTSNSDPVSSSAGDQSAKDIKIGVAGPMTADYAIWGESTLQGAQIAVDEFNEKGGLNGRKVAIVPVDDKGDPKEAATVAQKLVNDPDVVAVVGHNFSAAVLTAAPIYQREGLPHVVVTASNPKIPDVGDCIFTISLNDNQISYKMADYAVLEMGWKKIAILRENSDYGVATETAFTEQTIKNGGEIVAVETYLAGQDRDFSVQLTKIRETDPDCILLAGFATEAGLIVQQASQLGIKKQFYGVDGVNSDVFFELGKESAEGTIIATLFDRGVEEAKPFVDKYEKKYNEEIFSTSPYAYDAMNVVLTALTRAESVDRKGLRDAIADTNNANLTGVTGKIVFAENGLRDAGWLAMIIYENGEVKVKDIYK